MRSGSKQGKHGSSALLWDTGVQRMVLPWPWSEGLEEQWLKLNGVPSSPTGGRNRGSRDPETVFQSQSAAETCTCSPSFRTSLSLLALAWSLRGLTYLDCHRCLVLAGSHPWGGCCAAVPRRGAGTAQLSSSLSGGRESQVRALGGLKPLPCEIPFLDSQVPPFSPQVVSHTVFLLAPRLFLLGLYSYQMRMHSNNVTQILSDLCKPISFWSPSEILG